MSQNPFNDSSSFKENSQKNNFHQSSQINNNSLNILNKISAISIKNLSKNSSFDINEFSFLQDPKYNPPQIKEQLSPIKPLYSKSTLNFDNNSSKKKFTVQEEKPFLENNNEDLKNINSPGKNIKKTEYTINNGDFPFSNKKNPSFNLGEKSLITNSTENFDFLLKNWGDYFYDDNEPSKIKVYTYFFIKNSIFFFKKILFILRLKMIIGI